MNVFDEKISLGPVVQMYIKNWKFILFTVVGCTLFAGIYSYMLTPRYQAKTSFFIPYNISYDLAVENPQFGYDVEADRLLQILNSEQLKDSVATHFNLVAYYKIDTTKFGWQDQLSEKYNTRVFANRTNAMSIVITAETHDPLFSTEIVKYILSLSQRMRERMLKSNSALAVESFKKEYLKKLTELDSIRNRIIALRKVSSAPSIPLVDDHIILGNGSSSNGNSEASVELEILTQKHINEYNRLNELKGKYENALSVMERPVPKFYMLDAPTPFFRKTFPLIGFNISITFIGSLCFMLIGLYLKYLVKSLKQQSSSN
jgi:capsular polysaccharide biosynthesis protein